MAKRLRHSPPDVSETDVLTTEHEVEVSPHADLIAEIKETADKLAGDKATRGDLKILSRALKELRYAFKVFTPMRRQRKITVFGSARMPASHPAYQQSVEYGRKMAEAGWMVVTGAGGGIMEGGHVGAGRKMSIGLNILLPFEQDANYVIDQDEKLINLKYFFTRKLLFVKEVHAIALFPGGFGTQDEGFETLTLVQTGKRDLMPVVLVDQPGGSYWKSWLEYVRENLLGNELISPDDLSLFKVTDDVDDAVEEVLGFYSVYHSMRYVRNKLVIRLHKEPDDALLERLNDEFGEIIPSGRIERATVHKFEADDEHLHDLPRLTFDFDRKSIGRLRQMIDLINEELGEAEEDE